MAALNDLATLPVLLMRGEAVRSRRVEGERITLAVFELDPGATVPMHDHPQEQIGICLSGSIRFRVGDEERELLPGGTWRIGSGVPHEATAGAGGAIAIEVFSPIRDDWAFPELPPSEPRWPPAGG